MYEDWLYNHGYNPDKLYNIDELQAIDESILLEMASVDKRDSKLPYVVWIDTAGVDRGNEHTFSPRVKVRVPGVSGDIPITISENPEIPKSVLKNNPTIRIPKFSEVKEWIIAYRKILLAHYFKKITDKQALSLLLSTDKAEESELKLGEYLNDTPHGKIEWYYNAADGIYEAKVIDDDGNIVVKSVELTKYAMWEEVQTLKDVYEIEDNNVVYLGEK